MLIAFEGLDQSGKETQARHLRARLEQDGRKVRSLSFPDYGTSIGQEIQRALAGDRDYSPEVMQLLYIANRFEYKPRLTLWLQAGDVVICDRYRASSVAYGEAQGLDARWLESMQAPLPEPDVTILLDMAPETSLARKQTGRDKYERDLELLGRVRQSYLRQAKEGQWTVLDAVRDREVVAQDVRAAVAPLLTRHAPGPAAP